MGNSGAIEIIQQGAGSPFWEIKASTTGTVNVQTKYIARVVRNQRHVDFGVFNTNGTAVATESYDATEDFGEGLFGLLTATEDMLFDNFSFTRLDQINPVVPRWRGTARTQLASAALQVTSQDWGGEAVLEWAGDAERAQSGSVKDIAQADVDLNSGADARLIVRYQNPDNYYAVEIGADTGGGSGPITLIKRLKGNLAGSTIKAWVDNTLEISTTGADTAANRRACAANRRPRLYFLFSHSILAAKEKGPRAANQRESRNRQPHPAIEPDRVGHSLRPSRPECNRVVPNLRFFPLPASQQTAVWKYPDRQNPT